MLCLEITIPTTLILPVAVVGGINFRSMKIQTLLFLENVVQTRPSPNPLLFLGIKRLLFVKIHGLRTPNEGKNQRNLKIQADVADKICCRHT